MTKPNCIVKIKDVIFEAIDDVNQLLPDEYKIEKSADTLLFDKSGKRGLDSLSLINFIVAVERKIEKNFGISVILTNENVIFRKSNQFMTTGTLSGLILEIIEEEK